MRQRSTPATDALAPVGRGSPGSRPGALRTPFSARQATRPADRRSSRYGPDHSSYPLLSYYLLLKQRLQRPDGREHARLDGSHRNVEHLGDLGILHALEVRHDKDQLLTLG